MFCDACRSVAVREIEMDDDSCSQTMQNIPPELSASVPRTIRFSDRSRSMPVVLALLFIATVIGVSLYGNHVARQVWQRSALRTQGIEAQAEITSLKRAGRGPDVATYTFIVNGQNILGLAEVPPELMHSLRETNSLAVRYLPSNPTINHPARWEWSLSSEWFLMVMLTGLLLVCSVTISKAYANRKLLVWGTPAAGSVTGCSSTKGSYTIHYEFRTGAGGLLRGSGQSLGRREAGERIWILYLPQNPRRNGPYPFSDYCVKE